MGAFTPQQTSTGDINQVAVELFDGLPARYDHLGYILSFGQDRRWRRELVSRVVVPPGARILDVATGPGGVAIALRRATGAEVVGIDLTMQMLRQAARQIARRSERHIALVQGRGEQLPFADGSFDAVTFEYLLRYVDDPQATLGELVRVLRPGGTLASMEFHVPDRRAWRGLWWFYTRSLLPLGGFLLGGREWYRVGRFLGPSISGHYRRYPVDWLVAAWRNAGCHAVTATKMSVGGGLVMSGTKAGDVRDRDR
jgi:demethylmenaquinone methyltransferase/2-methoxy-6-polyprenyl-1,4-benzoquinol methylase